MVGNSNMSDDLVPRVDSGQEGDEERFLSRLDLMIEEMESVPDVVRPSRFWEFLNEVNLGQLRDTGLNECKRTVNSNYFQFLPTGPKDPQFRAVLRRWLAHPTTSVLSARVNESSPFLDSRIENPLRSRFGKAGYALFVALLWEYAYQRAPQVLNGLEEPELGHPLWVRHRQRLITQDLCNSVIEYAAITESLPAGRPGGNGVIELGAGYGRLAWLFLREFPDVRYFIVDIPPALAIAEEYLTTTYADRPAFRFRRFSRFAQVQAEFEEARLGFLTPNQLMTIPPYGAGLFINVSSLHEMRPEQISQYLDQVGLHCRGGYFYTKQWRRSTNPHDRVVIRRDEYPIPSDWETVFDRIHAVQTRFFAALYRVPDHTQHG